MTAWGLLMAVGLPSTIVGGIVGLFIWRIQKNMERSMDEQKKRDLDRQRYEAYQVKMLTACTALSEANAIALQNGKCNGETHKALDILEQIKHDQQDFLVEQGIARLFIKEE